MSEYYGISVGVNSDDEEKVLVACSTNFMKALKDFKIIDESVMDGIFGEDSDITTIKERHPRCITFTKNDIEEFIGKTEHILKQQLLKLEVQDVRNFKDLLKDLKRVFALFKFYEMYNSGFVAHEYFKRVILKITRC